MGLSFGMGAVVASKLADKGKEARAVALMFAGLTIANIIGVPLGTYIGAIIIAGEYPSSLLLLLHSLLRAVLKSGCLHCPSPNSNFKESTKAFKKPEPWLIIGISAIGTGGLFTWISYIDR